MGVVINKGLRRSVVCGSFLIDEAVVLQELERVFNAAALQIQARFQVSPAHALLLCNAGDDLPGLFFRRKCRLDEITQDLLVLLTGHQDDVGAVDVSPCAADLLIIGDDVGRHLEVDDKRNVLLVIAHAELDGRDESFDLIVPERFFRLPVLFLFLSVPGVIRERGDSVLPQKIRQIIAVSLRQTVNDPASRHPVDVFQDPGVALRFFLQADDLNIQGIPRQRTSGDKDLIAELRLQIIHHAVVRRGRRCQHRNVGGQDAEHLLQPTVFQTEIVSPVGDAVRLIDHEQADPHSRKSRLHIVCKQGLGRDQDEVDLPANDSLKHFFPSVSGLTVQCLAAQAHPLGRLDLILHEYKKGADDKRRAGAAAAQKLRTREVDHALSPAGALNDERPPVQERRLDRLILAVAKAGVFSVQGFENRRGLAVDLSVCNVHRQHLIDDSICKSINALSTVGKACLQYFSLYHGALLISRCTYARAFAPDHKDSAYGGKNCRN